MVKSEHSILLKILERLTRVEERLEITFKTQNEVISEVRKHLEKLNDEVGSIEKRMDTIEILYNKAKENYERTHLYWKAVAFVFSPVITFIMICLIKMLLGLPIP